MIGERDGGGVCGAQLGRPRGVGSAVRVSDAGRSAPAPAASRHQPQSVPVAHEQPDLRAWPVAHERRGGIRRGRVDRAAIGRRNERMRGSAEGLLATGCLRVIPAQRQLSARTSPAMLMTMSTNRTTVPATTTGMLKRPSRLERTIKAIGSGDRRDAEHHEARRRDRLPQIHAELAEVAHRGWNAAPRDQGGPDDPQHPDGGVARRAGRRGPRPNRSCPPRGSRRHPRAAGAPGRSPRPT